MDLAVMTQPARPSPNILQVTLGERSYPIHIGERLLGHSGDIIRTTVGGSRAIIVTDDVVGRYFLHRLTGSLALAGYKTASIIVPAGEASKSWEQLGALLDNMLSQQPDRNTLVIALGGGVVGDLAGVAASLLLRGVPFIQIPTTLLAQVDSSVGGKTGVNTSYGKNTLGSFYQPRLVLIDTTTLENLPQRQLRAGYAEIIKYGIIADPVFYEWLLANGPRILAGDADALTHAITTSCRIKAAIVAQDETEQTGQRAWLNFGHTYAHALEAEAGYNDTLLHGEAVAIGMVMALKLSARLGLLDASHAARLQEHLSSMGLRTRPTEIQPMWNSAALMGHIAHDKKANAGAITFILCRKLGEVFVDKNVEPTIVEAILAEELR